MEQEERCRPIPAPRRLNPDLRKTDYENVTIELINKNLNINTENIHAISPYNEKIPNNKVFLSCQTTDDATCKSILTETNDLYGPNANENVPSEVLETSTPVPKPRKPQNTDIESHSNETYENFELCAIDAPSIDPSATSHRAAKVQRYTGAISKDLTTKFIRKAPDLPPKTNFSGNAEKELHQRYSINSSEYSTTSSTGGGIMEIQERKFLNSGQFKSDSNSTLNSSVGDSNESAESSKYKSPSPGYVKSASCSSSNNSTDDDINSNFENDSVHQRTELDANDLLKSLGSTSKLLTESLGERVALKAKGAKHKFDKSLKSSSDAMFSIGTETTNRLKNVSKQFGYNFTLGKNKDKDKHKDNDIPEIDIDRPQTLPPNDKVFNTITFTSPLNKKVTGVDDLRTQELDTSYETPRSCRMTNNEEHLKAPPSYEDVINSTCKNSIFSRNIAAPQSLVKNKQNIKEQSTLQLSTSNPSVEDMSRNSLNTPMPNFPPPELPKEIAVAEGLYGKINHILPPTRQRRRNNCESTQLRRPIDSSSSHELSSLRVNVNSSEIQQMHREALKAEGGHALRSDSWEYFEENNMEGYRSSPEPVYANHEPTYGKLSEMATLNNNILPAEHILVSICEDVSNEQPGAHAISRVKPQDELIREFDPLENKRNSKAAVSNQLLLLEHLLEEETYGRVQRTKECSSDDDMISVSTSEEDNAQNSTKTNTIKSPTNDRNSSVFNNNEVQIVHQNALLLSDSMENILDDREQQIRACLSRVDEVPKPAEPVDLSRRAQDQNRTNWFLPEEKKKTDIIERTNPFNKSNNNDTESPPTYLEAIGTAQKSRAQRLMNPINVFNNVKIRVDALKRKASFKAAQKSSEVKVTLQMVPRPSISPLFVRHEGPLIRFPTGVVEDILKEMQNRRATLRDRQFQTYQDQEMKTLKECIPLESITTIQCVSNNRVTDSSTQFYCFEITTSVPKRNNNHVSPNSNNVQAMSSPNIVLTSNSSGNCKHQRDSHLYGVGKESERGIWMQKLLESLTNVLPTKYTCQYYRAGWCYLKNSITSEWSGSWVVLKKNQRRLLFVTEATMNVEKLDLRKARCIVLKESDETIKNLYVENGAILMIDCPPHTLYMIMNSQRETKVWRHIIREVAHNNGFSLNEQQLTKFNVPVIVDKCINFIYIHGAMSEGIYRKSGSEQSILKLMSAFRADAFNVEITRNEYNEHDVANVLKRFMRDLPERLMGKFSESFFRVSEINVASEKIDLYKDLLAGLSVIERETLKKILGHLSFICSLKDKNKMCIQNLTMIWGPTLLQCQTNSDDMVYSQKECNVLTDLITLYKNLFPLTPDEVKKEQEMLCCLQRYYAASENLTDSVKKSGDLKMWITLNPNPENTSEENTQINVTITPTKTAYEVCKELAPKMNMAMHEIALFEVILNGTLERPLHHDTKIFDVIFKWSYWPEDDRKNNILAVKPIDVLREVQRAVKNLATVTPGKELKFADNRTKTFKSYQCELRDGKIVISKKERNDKTSIIREIFLHSSTAYLGCEKKRDFPWSWAITFVENATEKRQILRSRDSPFIGHVLAGSEWMDRTIWFASIWYFLYGDNILPPAEIIIN